MCGEQGEDSGWKEMAGSWRWAYFLRGVHIVIVCGGYEGAGMGSFGHAIHACEKCNSIVFV